MEKLKEIESGSPEEKLTQREENFQKEIKKLTHELAGERKTIAELRNFIDVLRIGWSSDKKKLLKATEKLNEIEVCSTENKIKKFENDNFSEHKKLTTKDCCIKMKISSDSKKKIYKTDERDDDVIVIDDDPLRKTDKTLIHCPLCYNDSFPSQETLKFHLLDVIGNIFCSVCTKKFDDIISLANHLEDGCDGNSTFQPENKSEEQDIEDIKFEALDINNIKQEEEESLEDFEDIQFEASHPVIDINDIKQEEELYAEDLEGEEEDLSSYVEVIEEKGDIAHHKQGLLESNHIHHDGYWIKMRNYYKFINNEEKIKLLYPSFVPSKYKIKSSEFKCRKSFKIRSLKLIDKLEFIQIVDDKWLPSVPLHQQIRSNIIIYIVDQNKAWDKRNLGPIAKKISKLNCSKIKNSDSDDVTLEVCNSNSQTNKLFCDGSNTQKHLIPFIQVLKVSLENDEEITIENINFGELPAFPDSIVPFLDNVTHPLIPLLEGAKELKWHCKFCLRSFSTIYFAFRSHTCYQCKYCKKGFRKNMPVFMSHLLRCAKGNASAASPYACSSCPSFFETLEEAREHIPLHASKTKSVQCHLCYCFFSDKTVLQHLRDDHDTDFTSSSTDFHSQHKSARLPKNSSTLSERNINNTCELDSTYQHNTKPLYKTDETLPVMGIKVTKIGEKTLSRSSSRKRKINQTYYDEYFVN